MGSTRRSCNGRHDHGNRGSGNNSSFGNHFSDNGSFSNTRTFGRPTFDAGSSQHGFQMPPFGAGFGVGPRSPFGGGPSYAGGRPYGGGPNFGDVPPLGGNSNLPFGQAPAGAHGARPWYPGDARVDSERFPPPLIASQPLNEVTFNAVFRPVPATAIIVLHGVGDFNAVLKQAMKLLTILKNQHEIRISSLEPFCSPDTLSSVWHDALRADLPPENSYTMSHLGFGTQRRSILLLQGACEQLRHRLIEVTWTPNRVSDHFVQGSQRVATQVYGEIWTKGANIITAILLAAQHSHHLDRALSEAKGLIDYLERTQDAWVAQDEMRRSWIKHDRSRRNEWARDENEKSESFAKPQRARSNARGGHGGVRERENTTAEDFLDGGERNEEEAHE